MSSIADTVLSSAVPSDRRSGAPLALTASQTWILLFLGCIILGALFARWPQLGFVVLGAAALYVLWRLNILLPLLAALPLVLPLHKIFYPRVEVEYSTSDILHTMEVGDPPRRQTIVILAIVAFVLLVRNWQRVRRVNILPAYSALLLACVASLFWSPDFSMTARRIVLTFGGMILPLCMGCLFYGRSSDGLARFARDVCTIAVGCCTVILGVSVYNRDFNLFNFGWRLGSLGHENQISWFGLVGFLIAWVLRKEPGVWPNRVALWASLIIPGATLLLTKSRTSWLAAILSLIVMDVIAGRFSWSKMRRWSIIAIAAAIFLSSSWFHRLWQRGADYSNVETASGRTSIWVAVLRDIKESPFLGEGYGAYWTPQRVARAAREFAATSAHNGYLETLAQLGILGLVTCGSIVVVASRNAAKLLRHERERNLALLSAAFVTVLLVLNTGESFFDAFDAFPLMVVLTLFAIASARVQQLQGIVEVIPRPVWKL